MKKSKEGSTLIVTVIIFMFVTTVSVAFLSMITSNYYSRISESKRVQNLYGSESGIDITYNIIAKTVEAASFLGNQKVQELKTAQDIDFNEFKNLNDDDKKALYALYADIKYWKYYNGNLKENEVPINQTTIDNNIKRDNDDIDKLINKVFKISFKEFVQDNLQSCIENTEYIQVTKNSDGTILETTEKLDVGNANIYMKEQSTGAAVTAEINVVPKIQEDKITVGSTVLKVESGYDDNGRIQYESYTLQFDFYNNEKYELIVGSKFETDSNLENTAKVGKNLRNIEANYSIRVPNYNEVAFKESVITITQPNKLVGLTVGGDMNINNVNKLNVSGNIFVQGNELNGSMDNTNRTFAKYNGGIILNNNSGIKKTINFNDNVFTRGSFNIKNNVNVIIGGDLYSKNIYAGDGNELSNNSSLTANKDVVVDNDLTVKATNTAINIKDFYGINDKEITNDGEKVRKSSSIIINDYKTNATNGSNLTISDKAYIMGVAYINTQDGYQTGESVAVKDTIDKKANYNAYSVPEDTTEKFKYDSPLQVLDEDNVYTKADHFWKYWKDRVSGNDSVDYGGVTLPKDNTYSVGAIVYGQGDMVRSHSPYDPNVETTIINPKRVSYARNVYTLGQNAISDADAKSLYDSVGSNAETVNGLLTNISDYKLEDKTNNGAEFAMFCSSESKNIVIKGENSIGNYTADDVVIDATLNKAVNAVIVTKGNVIIDGDINFRGNIIAGKDLNILGNSNSAINIYYDENITQDIQNSNGDQFNSVFGDKFGGVELNKESLNIQSNSSDFLKIGLWKIIQ